MGICESYVPKQYRSDQGCWRSRRKPVCQCHICLASVSVKEHAPRCWRMLVFHLSLWPPPSSPSNVLIVAFLGLQYHILSKVDFCAPTSFLDPASYLSRHSPQQNSSSRQIEAHMEAWSKEVAFRLPFLTERDILSIFGGHDSTAVSTSCNVLPGWWANEYFKWPKCNWIHDFYLSLHGI